MTMKNNLSILATTVFSVVLVSATTSVSFAAIATVGSGGMKNVRFPIEELGGCKSMSECKTYCAESDNMLSCINYAEKNNMLSGEELRVSKIVAEKVSKGGTPGGCKTRESCEAFCVGKVENINQCIAFGEELGVIPQADLAEAKKVAMALAGGAQLPGSCKTKGECENYCSAGTHIDECLNFAEAAGMMNAGDIAEARKVAPFLKNGETPGKCMTKDSCKAYCDDASHFDECIGFAEKAGFVSAEDAVIAKKVGGVGPGGCRGKEACQAYCDNEVNAEECANFARGKGLLSEQQKADIDTGVDRIKAALGQIPPEVKSEVMICLENSIGKEKFARIIAKQDMPTQSIGGKIEACFSQIEGLMKAKMMESVGASGVGSGAPSGAMPSSAPSHAPTVPSTSSGGAKPMPQNAPPSTQQGPAPTPEICAQFKSAPSCDYVPVGTARDLCLKCK